MLVTIVEVNGKQHELEVPAATTIAMLKDQSASVLMVPSEFQRFIIGGCIAEDHHELTEFLEEGLNSLDVTFFFSDGGVLTHESLAARCAAMEILKTLVSVGRLEAINVISKFCSDDNLIVRQAAMKAISEFAQSHSAQVLPTLVERLLDPNELVAALAVQALASVVDAGNEEARTTLLEFLEVVEDLDPVVQLAAVEACARMPEHHNKRLIRLLDAITRASSNGIVCSAAKGMADKLRHRRPQTLLDRRESDASGQCNPLCS